METQNATINPLDVSTIHIRLANGKDGLIGWASCIVNDAIYLNNIAIRRVLDGRTILTYPSKKTKNDLKYYFFNPINREAKAALENAILAKFQEMGGTS
jgi:DNA-binding cell septation regulator SpoVG